MQKNISNRIAEPCFYWPGRASAECCWISPLVAFAPSPQPSPPQRGRGEGEGGERSKYGVLQSGRSCGGRCWARDYPGRLKGRPGGPGVSLPGNGVHRTGDRRRPLSQNRRGFRRRRYRKSAESRRGLFRGRGPSRRPLAGREDKSSPDISTVRTSTFTRISGPSSSIPGSNPL